MSRERSIFASKTTFEALAVDSGEESEDEHVEESQVQPTSTPVSAPHSEARLTKTAQKKAAKAAKLEKNKQQKTSSKSPSFDNAPSTSHQDTEYAALHHPKISLNGVPDAPDAPAVVDYADKIPATPPASDALELSEAIVPVTSSHNGDATTEISEVPSYSAPSSPETSSRTTPEPQLLTEVDAKDVHPVDHSSPAKETTKEVSHLKASQLDSERTKKMQNLLTRTIWTFIMIGVFIALLLLGHGYMVILVMLCQTLVYREVTRLFSLKASKAEREPHVVDSDVDDPWKKTLNWYFFAVANYFLYGESIIYYFKHVVFIDASLLPFATNHRMISFTLYTIGFMGFVMSLQKGYLKQQFGLFCWVHMSLLLIVVSSHFIVNNILEGMIWFFVPASLVICNDCFAYVWGITIGRTPLIKLSPKKTVEGFVGAFFSTILFGLVWGTYFMRFDYMTCPVHDLGVSAWSSVTCDPNPAFIWQELVISKPVAVFLSSLFGTSIATIPYAPYQIHLFFMSCFASLVAPFGGFFASGFKRAFNIKDFGHSIPGHGGMTDRMDCQFLMGIFTYVYYSSIVREHHVTVGSVLQTIVSGLSKAEQVELFMDLKRFLESQGISLP